MRPLLALFTLIAFIVTGCTTLGLGTGDAATRILAGLQCVAAITAAGGQVTSDPDLGFATATDAFNAINKVATSPGLSAAMAACSDTFSYLSQDLAGAVAMLKTKTEAPAEPPAQRKARLAKVVPKPQMGPVKVVVPLK